MTPIFTPEDFGVDHGALTPFGMAERANQVFDLWFACQPLVYGEQHSGARDGQKIWTEFEFNKTHKARLVCIEPIGTATITSTGVQSCASQIYSSNYSGQSNIVPPAADIGFTIGKPNQPESTVIKAEPKITSFNPFPSAEDQNKRERKFRIEEMVKALMKDPEHSGPYKKFVDVAVEIIDDIDTRVDVSK